MPALRLHPVERRTLADRVHEELRHGLMVGRFLPGETLSLRTLSEAMGTSVMPIREAVTRLASDNCLEVLPRRGIRVPALTLARFDEVWRLRALIEGEAAALAAERASPADLAVIAEHSALAADALGPPVRPLAVIEHTKAMLFAIYTAARTETMLPLIEMLWTRCGPHRMVPFHTPDRAALAFLRHSCGHHDRLLAALHARDGAAAGRIRAEDIAELAAFLRTRLMFTDQAEPHRAAG